MSAYYNEIDPVAAKWLRSLIVAGHIAPGEVDERSIEDVVPTELAGYTQCHFFAGIGVWSLALRNAGWPDDRAVWTGSCPCQPFSTAGKGDGFADERHLWPAFFHLIGQCQPSTVLGEQVASRGADVWIDLVQDDMEAMGYAFGALPFPSAGVGAPHIRDRLYWVANSDRQRRDRIDALQREERKSASETSGRGAVVRLGNASSQGLPEQRGRRIEAERFTKTGFTRGFWERADWLYCRDGKYRPVEPGTFPMAASTPGRVGRLRAYGNAINAEAAKAFIKSTGLV